MKINYSLHIYTSFNNSKKFVWKEWIIRIAFVNFEKCFDKLQRSFIFQKLIQENVSSSVKSAVRYNKEISLNFISNIGAKQGDPSSSLLFLFFVNDIIHNINWNIDGIFTVHDLKLFMLLFADDIALFANTSDALLSMLNYLNMESES
jgi:hypothetical protein